MFCRHERCPIVEEHEAHEEDFKPRRRRRRSKAAVAALMGRPKIVRRVQTPTGLLAYVRCPRCDGTGCDDCQHTGEMSLYRWHLFVRAVR